MLLTLLRFMRGYVRFTVRGRFPERFINISLHNRLRLWDVVRQKDQLSACMYMRDYLRVRRCARESGVRLNLCERRGLPVVLRRYSDRAGIALGAATFVLTVFVMSLFIWSIDITGLDAVSESEMRSMLRDNGLYIGAFKPAVDDMGVSRAVMLSDSRVGWMAVNVTGSYASVEIKEESPSPEIIATKTPANVKARRDGTILRIEAQEGSIAIKEGSGVVEGQVIVSGVMEDALGGQRLVHADAKVIAQTDYHADFSIPDTIESCVPTGEVSRRLSADLFGLKIPLTLASVSTVDTLSDEVEEAPSPLDVRLPAGLLIRDSYALEKQRIRLDDARAKELLLREARLYEVFTLSDCTVTDRDYHFSRASDGYTMSVDYTCTEDIAFLDPIGTE